MTLHRRIESCPRIRGPEHWNRFGGWRTGPQLKATGHFYAKVHQGKWWLVDPEGRLFWSHGVNCVGGAGITPITDREFYFADLPSSDVPLAKFYGRASWAPHGYYHERGGYRTYNFTGANLYRKFGDDWFSISADLAHRRLRSWSMNTIAQLVRLARLSSTKDTVRCVNQQRQGKSD